MGFEDLLDFGVGGVGEGDDAMGKAAGVRGVGDALQPGRLLDGIGMVDLGLEVDRLYELLGAGVLEEVGQQIAPADRREGARGMAGFWIEPGIAVGLDIQRWW